MQIRVWSAAALAAVILFVTVACDQSPKNTMPAKPVQSKASKAWAAVTASFIEDYFRAQPMFASNSGRHDFDGQLPDLSAHGLKREIARLHDARDTINGVDPKPLLPNERLERDTLLWVIDSDLFWLEKSKMPATSPYWYRSIIDPNVFLTRAYAPLDVRLKAFIRYLRGIPKMATDIQANLAGPLPKTYVELGIASFGGLSELFKKDAVAVFASVTDADLQKQLTDAATQASISMGNLKIYLEGQRKSANDAFVLGADRFSLMLEQTEHIGIPLDQIEAAGKADLEKNTEALKAECANYLPKGTLAACVAKMSADKPKGGTVEEARKQVTVLKQFVQSNNLVSIPSDDEALVADAPAYNRSNTAYISPAGPYDKGVASTYYIAPPDAQWSKAEQAAYIPGVASLMDTTIHEVWPGHFLQFLHSNSNPSKVEALWIGSVYAEGWAHYAEQLMIEEGFGKDDPAIHIGQLHGALLRDVRLLSAIGLHTHGMTVAQSEKLFKEQAFSDPGTARQQAARGTFDPGYLCYTVGKLMILKLRTDWVAKNPGSAADPKAAWHDFHDKFLSYGGPPVPLLRKELLGDDSPAL